MTVIQETVIYADPVKFGVNAGEAKAIAIKIGGNGYSPILSRLSADELNPDDVTPEIVESAVAGSMFGWGCPAAKAALLFAEWEES